MTGDRYNCISAGCDDSIARLAGWIELIEKIRRRLAGGSCQRNGIDVDDE